jgi:hypothetical protein
MALVFLGLGSWGADAEMFEHALAEAFALFGGHAAAAVVCAIPETVAAGTVPTKSAEEDAAEREESHGLPEGDLPPAEERRQQPVPQVQHDLATDEDKDQHSKNREWNNENQFYQSSGHVESLTFS